MTRFWHGGAPGLRPGDLITPRAPGDSAHLVDGCPICEARKAGTPLEDDHLRPDRIYVTTMRDYARIYAAGYPLGALYVVEPLGELEHSNLDDPAPSWAVPAARVLQVYDPVVNATAKDMRTWYRRAMRWATETSGQLAGAVQPGELRDTKGHPGDKGLGAETGS